MSNATDLDAHPRPSGANASPAPELGPISRTSLTDETVACLQRWILARSDAGPTRLPSERDLAQRLQVSRIVVREALGRLTTRGLLEVRPGVGTFIAPVRDASVTEPLRLYLARRELRTDDLFGLRLALEPAIAAAASERADAATVQRLRDAVERIDAVAGAIDPSDPDTLEAFAWSDLAFHQELAHASGNPLFDLLLAPLIDRLLEVRRAGARVPGAVATANEGHGAVLRAVEAGDAEAAAVAMRAHLHEVRALLPADAARQAEPDLVPTAGAGPDPLDVKEKP